MMPKIRKEIKQQGTIRADQDFTAFLNSLMDGIRKRLIRSGYMERQLEKMFLNVQSWVNRQSINTIKRKKNISDVTLKLTIANIEAAGETDIAKQFVENFKRTNLELVELAGNQYIDDIYKIAEQGYLKGESLKTMTESMKDLTMQDVNKAKFWAQDQIGNAYADYNMAAQKSSGIERYRWLTVGDNKVRDNHAELEGRIFTWGRGAIDTGLLSKPGAKHPGQDYRCRCFPEPVLPGEK